MDVRALASAGFTLVQRYGVDLSRALLVLALLCVPGAGRLLLSDWAYAPGVATGAYALLLGASLWAGLVGSRARRAAALDPAVAPVPPAQEWWRPWLVQQHGVEIAKALAVVAILGCPAAVCSSTIGPRPYVLGIAYLLLWGAFFWTSAVGSEARRIAAQHAAARAALTQDPGAPGAPTTSPTFGATSPAPPPASTHADKGVAKLVTVGANLWLVVALALVVVKLLAFAFLAWVCLLLLYGLGHGQPPPWLLP